MTFKKGDKVEYRGGTWVFDEYGCVPEGYCYIAYGEITLYVSVTEVKPIKSAHDKLIDMGYECLENNDRIAHYQEDNMSEILFNKRHKFYAINPLPDNIAPPTVTLELSRVLTQYLEEMEDK